jgi:hypothetical protein
MYFPISILQILQYKTLYILQRIKNVFFFFFLQDKSIIINLITMTWIADTLFQDLVYFRRSHRN